MATIPTLQELPPIVYEDEAIIAFDKPSGMLVAPDRWNASRLSIVGLIQDRWKGEVVNVNRLDADTSGLIICGRGRQNQSLLASQMDRHVAVKKYLALVRGHPSASEVEVTLPLGPDALQVGRMRVSKREGKPAHTKVEVLERFRNLTLLACIPKTGRTHQIRVHLMEIECPIVGDTFYGSAEPVLLSQIKKGYKGKDQQEERPLLSRLALHLSTVTLTHPVTGETISIEAPLPREIALTLKYLRQHSVVRVLPTQNSSPESK